MIPTVGLMIGAYICFRMMEVWLLAAARYSSKEAKVVAMVGSIVVFLVTVVCSLSLFSTGITATR